jgi:hypothetical protein
MKCCAKMYFNQPCLNKKVITKYANIMISYTSPATNITLKKVQKIRIRDSCIYKL